MAQSRDAPVVDRDGGAPVERDLVRTYLEEIGRTPLLDAEQEVDLAKAIEAGLYGERLLAERATALAGTDTGDDVDADKPSPDKPSPDKPSPDKPSPDEPSNDELELLVEAGRLAKDTFVRANLRLVVSVARKYTGKGVPLLDLIQEGNLGLVRAVEKFDYRRGFKFSTYATWWIRQAVGRAVAEQSRTIRVPVAVAETLAKLSRTRSSLVADLGREPTESELAQALDMPAERVAELRRWVRDPVSLDLVVGDDEESTLGDFIGAADSSVNPEEMVIAAHDRERLQRMLSRLEPQAAEVIRWRYGLVDGKTHTLTEVGERCGMGREGVRRIERESLARLRALAGDPVVAA
jgi:RNA polymerase sigma factor (sigma-70 family)